MDKRKIKFVKDHEVQDEHRGTSKATVYKSGEIKSVSISTADHFTRRGIAVFHDDAPGKSDAGEASFSGTAKYKANGETEIAEGVKVANVDLITAAAAHESLDAKAWNALASEERETLIAAEIERRQAPAE